MNVFMQTQLVLPLTNKKRMKKFTEILFGGRIRNGKIYELPVWFDSRRTF